MIEGKSGGRRKGRDGGSVSLGGRGAARSIIPTQTPLGFRLRDSTERRRDKSLLLTFERTATYSNNLKRGGETAGDVWPSCLFGVFLFAVKGSWNLAQHKEYFLNRFG